MGNIFKMATIGRLNWLNCSYYLYWSEKICVEMAMLLIWTSGLDFLPSKAGYFLFYTSVLYISQSDKCRSELCHRMVTCLVVKIKFTNISCLFVVYFRCNLWIGLLHSFKTSLVPLEWNSSGNYYPLWNLFGISL